MKFKDLFFVSLILWKEILVVSSASNYYDGLIKYLKSDSRLRQIVYLLDDELVHSDPLMDSLMSAVNSHFPSFTVKYSDINSNLTKQRLQTLLRPKITGLFVLQWTENTPFDKFEEFFTDQNDLLKGPTRPKCLIVPSYPIFHIGTREILSFVRDYNFMEFSVLINMNERTLKIEQNHNKLILIIEKTLSFPEYWYAGLYIPEFDSAELSPKSQWFSKHILSTNNSYVYEYFMAINFLRILTRQIYIELETLPLVLLNSEMIFYVYNHIWSKLSHFEYEAKDLYPNENINYEFYVRNGDVGLINILLQPMYPVKAVIPQMSKNSKEIIVSTEFWYMIIVTVCTISVIRLVAFLIKFNNSTWQTLNISQIIMGMSANREPRNLAERTVFGSLIITCIVFTGYFYSIILDISFRPSPEISTLTDLLNSNLTPLMTADVHFALSYYGESELANNGKIENIGRQLAKKGQKLKRISEKVRIFEEDSIIDDDMTFEEYSIIEEDGTYDENSILEGDCLLKYIDYKNISCLINNSPHHVKNYLSKNGRTNVKILEETVSHSYQPFLTESFTPYLDDFIKRILNVLEFGLSREIYRTNVNLPQTNNKSELQMISKEQIFVALFYVGTIGYSLATMAFILEVITAKIRSKFFPQTKISICKLTRCTGVV